MKTPLVTAGLLLLAATWCPGVPSDVVYTDGEASVRYKSGRSTDAAIGDLLDTGDTVTTGFDGFVELDQAGLKVKINPETVFTLQEKEQAGAKTGVLGLVLGSIKFRFDKITGKEPLVQTGACVAGVRGTEFTVFAGADGSSLIVVDSGLVEVEASGAAVALGADEGVEVRPGEAPGQKFKVQRDQVDYRTWNDQKIAAMLADPEQAIERIATRLEFYTDSITQWYTQFEAYNARLKDERAKAREITAKQGADAGRKHQDEVVLPLAGETMNLGLNVRYYALAALSLRRYVAGRMYVTVKAQSMGGRADTMGVFRAVYGELLEQFEESVVPHLVEADL
jgi:hypothetical protein